jgi:predicted thioredoxin/glutaredoxin
MLLWLNVIVESLILLPSIWLSKKLRPILLDEVFTSILGSSFQSRKKRGNDFSIWAIWH